MLQRSKTNPKDGGEAEAGYAVDPDDDIGAKLNRSSTQKSASSLAFANRKKQQEAEKTYGLWTLIKLIGSFNKKEWKLMVVGLLFSAICGAGNPTQAVFFAKLINAL